MTDSVRQAVIDRLWNIAEGAKVPRPQYGICNNAATLAYSEGTPEWNRAGAIACDTVLYLTGSIVPWYDSHKTGKWHGIRGNQRRIFAGLLACYLTDEQP